MAMKYYFDKNTIFLFLLFRRCFNITSLAVHIPFAKTCNAKSAWYSHETLSKICIFARLLQGMYPRCYSLGMR